MPRYARITVPGLPHHITQWGNNKTDIFLSDIDYQVYLTILSEQLTRWDVRMLGYSLLPNHANLVLTPQTDNGLARAVGLTHSHYTQYVNAKYHRSGHLWQNRFFSCVLDDVFTRVALRYIERDPVRQNLVERAKDWRWSSATAHLGGEDPTRMLYLANWQTMVTRDEWGELLATREDETQLARLRLNTQTGRPLGDDAFLDILEAAAGRRLRPQKAGRPRKIKDEG